MKWSQWLLLAAFLAAVFYLVMTGSNTAFDANGNVVHINNSL